MALEQLKKKKNYVPLAEFDSSNFSLRVCGLSSHRFMDPVPGMIFQLVDQALNPMGKWLVTPMIFVPQLHRSLSCQTGCYGSA